jgi:hypothetical protein
VVSPSPSYYSLSDVSAINPLVAFYDIHGGKNNNDMEEIIYCYFKTLSTAAEMVFTDVNDNTLDTSTIITVYLPYLILSSAY